MIELQELSPHVTIRQQLGDVSPEPVVLINLFQSDPAKAEELVAAWADDARYFKAQPGFISAQLHRGIGGSGSYLNYAVWESVAAFRAAFSNPVFQAKLAGYPDGTTASPHLFRKLAVPGLCVA